VTDPRNSAYSLVLFSASDVIFLAMCLHGRKECLDETGNRVPHGASPYLREDGIIPGEDRDDQIHLTADMIPVAEHADGDLRNVSDPGAVRSSDKLNPITYRLASRLPGRAMSAGLGSRVGIVATKARSWLDLLLGRLVDPGVEAVKTDLLMVHRKGEPDEQLADLVREEGISLGHLDRIGTGPI